MGWLLICNHRSSSSLARRVMLIKCCNKHGYPREHHKCTGERPPTIFDAIHSVLALLLPSSTFANHLVAVFANILHLIQDSSMHLGCSSNGTCQKSEPNAKVFIQRYTTHCQHLLKRHGRLQRSSTMLPRPKCGPCLEWCHLPRSKRKLVHNSVLSRHHK